jgi:ATP-dependent helicase/nuclease subunit A
VSGIGTAPLLRPKKDERLSPFAELIDEQERRDLQEHWRLLYVALTRAADRLIVAGVAPRPKKDGSDPRPENCWHRAVQAGLLALGAAPLEEKGRTTLAHGSAPVAGKRPAAAPEAPAAQLPSWATIAAPPEARPPRPLAPSALAEDREAAPPPSAEMRAAAERGTMIHALLERLPAVSADQREQAALRWLERSGGVADANSRKEIASTICEIISDTRFAGLFGRGSLGEAPIAATLPDGRVIAGTVDRLRVEEHQILVVDYKTGRAPERQEDIPLAHRLQMQAYAEALSVIFPDRDIEAALLYTANGRFFTVES